MKIMANPADINVLPGCCLLYSALPHLCCNCIDRYKNDPRTVDKLLDGVNRTCDDLHMWLAPFTRHVTEPQILHSKAQTSKYSPPSLQRPASLCLHRPRSRHDTQSHQVFCTDTVTFFFCASHFAAQNMELQQEPHTLVPRRPFRRDFPRRQLYFSRGDSQGTWHSEWLRRERRRCGHGICSCCR